MVRVTNGVASRARHKKILKSARGYYGRRHSTHRAAARAVDKSLLYAYRDRRQRRRTFRRLWIQRINAAVREGGLNYSQFIALLNKSETPLNRKVLADLAYDKPDIFQTFLAKLKG